MELKEGMYVRTKEGNIGKITFISPLDSLINLDTESYSIGKHFVDKASYNIIDLIEDDDLIEYRRYGELVLDRTYSLPFFDKYKLFVNCNGEVLDLEDLDIVSIVTKEMFESMSYKVGGND